MHTVGQFVLMIVGEVMGTVVAAVTMVGVHRLVDVWRVRRTRRRND